jgi:hypothetical protein
LCRMLICGEFLGPTWLVVTGHGVVRFPLDVLSDGRRHIDKQRCDEYLGHGLVFV